MAGLCGHGARVAPLWNAYQALVIARDKRDPLNLDLPERRVIIGEDGKVKSIDYRDRLESMRVIEELMIQANVAAAESLEKARMPIVYRVHEHPSKEKLFAFSDYLRTINISFAKGQVVKPGIFNRILAQAKEGVHAEIMNDVVLRTQAQAIYSPDNIGHFGLNLQRYAHFTSPIRRYADLIVHRALIRALKLGSDGLTDREMQTLGETAEHISRCERRAMAAERDSTERYVAAFMKDREGATFQARITGVTRLFNSSISICESCGLGALNVMALARTTITARTSASSLISGPSIGLAAPRRKFASIFFSSSALFSGDRGSPSNCLTSRPAPGPWTISGFSQ